MEALFFFLHSADEESFSPVAVTREPLVVIRPVLRMKPLEGGFHVPWFPIKDVYIYILARGHGFIHCTQTPLYFPYCIWYTFGGFLQRLQSKMENSDKYDQSLLVSKQY